MKPSNRLILALLLGLVAVPSVASARGLSVTVRTDRGTDAVYKPGDALEIEARTTDDAYLLIYEIDAEGYVHVLFPHRRTSGFVEGRQTYKIPDESDVELVAQGPVGQGYIVAIASVDPFQDLPWFLRSRNAQAEEIGYHGDHDEEEGITPEGRIVGDPFVAMERIRRRVLENPEDEEAFATAYASYYVHHEVNYPRYLCYDCHRPGRWQWWDGFDPYYTSCSVFDFRVNRSWWWGPTYWYGFVPHYVYVYRTDCPPRYRSSSRSGVWHSSWEGWRRWRGEWGGRLTRYKSAPPAGYVPPAKFTERGSIRDGGRMPPGFARGGDDRRPRDLGPRGGDARNPRGDRRWASRGDQRAPRVQPGARPNEGEPQGRTWRDERQRREPRPAVEPTPGTTDPDLDRRSWGGRRPRLEPRDRPDAPREVRPWRGQRPRVEPRGDDDRSREARTWRGDRPAPSRRPEPIEPREASREVRREPRVERSRPPERREEPRVQESRPSRERPEPSMRAEPRRPEPSYRGERRRNR